MNTVDFVHAPPAFLASMSHSHRETLSRFAMPRHFAAGEQIFSEGEPANRFYLIQKGRVSLQTRIAGETVELQELKAGDVLGWSWLFPPYYWHYDAVALEDTDSIFLYATPLREECEADPVLGYEIMKRISAVVLQRLHSTRRRLVEARTPHSIGETYADSERSLC